MMDSANLPSQTDLNSLYGAWNPMAYMEGQKNQDLAAQFRNQAFDANNNTVTKGILENDQSAQMNPLLLTQQDLTNTGLGLSNTGKGISNKSAQLDLNSKTDAYDDTQKLLHSKLAREMSDEDITKEGNTYLKAYREATLNNRPEEADKYRQVLDTLVGAVASKAGDRVQGTSIEQAKGLFAENVARIHAKGMVDAAGLRGSKPGADPYTFFNKLPPATRLGVAQSALAAGVHPVTHEELTANDRTQLEALIAQDTKTLDSQNAARGNAQGATAQVNPETKKIELVNKQVPSVGGTKQPTVSDMRAALKQGH